MSHQLQRHIGLIGLTLYGVGDILGAGVYGLIGKAAGQMGYGVWLAFLVSMVAAGLTGLTYAALGSRFSRAAGVSYILQHSFGWKILSYTMGLATLCSGLTSMATASRVFAGYLTGLLPSINLEVAVVLFISLIGLIVYRGIRESMWVNSLCTVIELAGLGLIIFVGLPYLGQVNYLNFTTPTNLGGELSLGLLLSGAVLTFYSFIGFEDILNVSEEVKNPAVTVPRALLAAVVISSVIYMLVSLIAVSVVSPDVLADSKQPLIEVVKASAPWFPTSLYGIIALFAVANTALLNFVMGSRLMYGLSRLQLLPKFIGEVHAHRKTPHRAIALVYIILIILALLGDVTTLARSTSVLLLLVFACMNLSLIKIKWRERGQKVESFDVPILVPSLALSICLGLLTFSKAEELRLAGVILVGILLLYFVLRPSTQSVEHMDRV